MRIIMLACFFVCLTGNAHANRALGALERYNVEDLDVFYINKKNNSSKGRVAWVSDSDGYLHVLIAGENLGKNFGVVTKIDDCGVWFKDLRRDKNDDWFEESRVLFYKKKESICQKKLPKNTKPVQKKCSRKEWFFSRGNNF